MKHHPNFTIASSNFTTPVEDNHGSYLMHLLLGTPLQFFDAVIDTGSDLTWVQFEPCHQCYEQKGLIFEPQLSSSYKELSCSSSQCLNLQQRECNGGNCKYLYGYGDGTFSKGDFSTETVTMTTTTGDQQGINDFAFGCGHYNHMANEESDVVAQSGIVGLGDCSIETVTMTTTTGDQQGINDFAFGCGHYNHMANEESDVLAQSGIVGLGQSPVSLIAQLGSVIEQKFAYCLVSFDESSHITSKLLFGSVATINNPGVHSTPILKKAGSSHYYVGLNALSVGERRLQVNLPGGTIIDSGTTYTFLEGSAYAIVRDAFKAAIALPLAQAPANIKFDLCYNVEGRLGTYSIPTLSLHLTNTDFNPPPENYFELLEEENLLCLAMRSYEGVSIIGNTMQQNHHFEYDLVNSRLSFLRAPCGCARPSC
ncbi:hypothetical protein O6H91_14G049900 [Diphasiastrum complanatum]|uniref:Uncharacterized protein n=1 Tax=Diphasiastrum complanatum TaxID=34168 RepID=A0ACC2BPB4_DIPCM|nr:hypothetical protein O6H91_14G049900 [Diphasiastrum complanatum]